MAGYQFIHVEAYARTSSTANKKGERKRTAAEIVQEAERVPGHYERHVEQPLRPNLLHGTTPSGALAEAEEAAEATRDAAGRKLRKDAPVLLAGVVSCDASNADRWESIKADSLAYLKQKWGDRLRSVVEHLDEAHPHMHFYVVPKAGERALDLHPGHAAKKAAGDRKSTKSGALNAAYCEAMEGFQREYHEAVGVWHGLARIGPQRRRLTRKGWQAEKKAAADRVAGFDAEAEVVAEVKARKLASVLPIGDDSDGTPPDALNSSVGAKRSDALVSALQGTKIPATPAKPR